MDAQTTPVPPRLSFPYSNWGPAAAVLGVILALVIANHSVHETLWTLRPLLAAVVLGLSALMVSTVQFRSFKDLRLNWRMSAVQQRLLPGQQRGLHEVRDGLLLVQRG